MRTASFSVFSGKHPRILATVRARLNRNTTTSIHANARAAVDALIKPIVTAENKADIVAKIKSVIGSPNYMKCEDINKLRELYKAFKNTEE